jgi:hypothetical protein
VELQWRSVTGRGSGNGSAGSWRGNEASAARLYRVLESSAKAESGHRVVAAAEGTDGFGFLRRMMTSAMGHGACWASMREAEL